MKKLLIIFLLSSIVVGIVYKAAQSTISAISGIGSLIPHEMVGNKSYINHLRGTLQDIDSYSFQELRQRYKEDTEFKVKYVEIFQNILSKLAKENQVNR